MTANNIFSQKTVFLIITLLVCVNSSVFGCGFTRTFALIDSLGEHAIKDKIVKLLPPSTIYGSNGQLVRDQVQSAVAHYYNQGTDFLIDHFDRSPGVDDRSAFNSLNQYLEAQIAQDIRTPGSTLGKVASAAVKNLCLSVGDIYQSLLNGLRKLEIELPSGTSVFNFYDRLVKDLVNGPNWNEVGQEMMTALKKGIVPGEGYSGIKKRRHCIEIKIIGGRNGDKRIMGIQKENGEFDLFSLEDHNGATAFFRTQGCN